MIPVEIANVAVLEKRFIIFLKSKDDERVLPIFIDEQQAQSIIIQINHVEIPRPLTHDLFKMVLETLEFRVSRIEVSDVREDTFYARLVVEGKGDSFDFDARPSDAICLALRFGAPMFVDEKVMEKAGIIVTKENVQETRKESQNSGVETTPIEALKEKLKQAIQEERYEEAALLRDEINKMSKSN
ncbi:MAG: bifunctional nuclease domain-containing protein [Chitinivibrionales bacterium]